VDGQAADRLRSFDRPALIVWAAEDRVMPPGHAQRLADRLPDARVAMVPDSYTLIPLDQPRRLAALVREFVRSK
jgi:pimeloyl-ACP methyl ester carboxylesterase